MIRVEELPTRDTPAVLASAGGVVFEVDDGGRVLSAFRPFEREAADVPLHIAADDTRIYVGAGVGGGPRLQARDRVTGDAVYDVFVGDPSSRTGVSVSSLPTAPVGDVRIVLDLPASLTADQAAAVRRAAGRWEAAVFGPPLTVAVAVSAGPIDGRYGVAGYGGPTTYGPAGLPTAGQIDLDTADLTGPAIVEAITAHEIGHVLGIGTSPRWFGFVRGGSFVGPNAVGVYGGPVPLSPDRAHWSEDSLGDDLMSPVLGGPAPVSALTLAALRDMGYRTR